MDQEQPGILGTVAVFAAGDCPDFAQRKWDCPLGLGLALGALGPSLRPNELALRQAFMHLAKAADVGRLEIDGHQRAAGRIALAGEPVDGRGQKVIAHAVLRKKNISRRRDRSPGFPG